ncbi:1,5-anhydro-D-fructose reductase [Halyomorpha halys]|uniref:1,5-anhydro-D-fructose reductase n=1 Tax=Halyomorpha halys TaxID=286706 RepID=UPI0006D51064|nr:1,5-anhydro-D-fructose reductase-like isoform X1 [Halyomorpha halys]XP_024218590.1 1,5-anhydro-D-fructose reductase-like isoform X2 [Halyomorpha halys]
MTKLDSKSVVTSGVMKMPIVGLGTWQSTPEEIETALTSAIDVGYRHIDTAFVYRNESAIGAALKKLFDSGKITREELFIVTKLPGHGNRREDVESFLKKSLEALQLDYVDLYLIHSPVGLQNKGFDQTFPTDEKGEILLDMNTNHVELWKGMEAQVDAGRAKSIGLSNFNQKQIKRILDNCRIPPANLQVELHIYLQQKELVSFCKENGVTVCAYAPIGSPGRKAEREKRGESTEGLVFPLEDPVIKEIAEKYEKQPSQVLLRYMIEYGVAVIPKSTNPGRIKQNFDVFDFELTKEEFEKINALDRGEAGRTFVGRGGRAKFMARHPEYAFSSRT